MEVLTLKSKRLAREQFVSVYTVSKIFFQHFIEEVYKDDMLYLQLSRALPMIYPPARWSNYNLGGYFLKPSLAMRATDPEQLNVIQRADMRRVYGSRAEQSSTACRRCPGASTASSSTSWKSSTTAAAARRRSL